MKLKIESRHTSAILNAIAAAGYDVHMERDPITGDTNLIFGVEVNEAAIASIVKVARTNVNLGGLAAYDPENLSGVTTEQLNTYIDNHVTDLASAKTVLKKMAVLVLYLYKREMSEV